MLPTGWVAGLYLPLQCLNPQDGSVAGMESNEQLAESPAHGRFV